MYITKIKIKLNNITKSYQCNEKKIQSQTFIQDEDLDCVQPNSSFFMEVGDNHFSKVGIKSKDLALIDNSLEPVHNDLVLVFLNGFYSIKRLIMDELENITLTTESGDIEDIGIDDSMHFEICGVVVYVLQNV
ncbi:MAG: LexA family protein [Patescibacteria group bacterium]